MSTYNTDEYKPTRRKSKFVSFVIMVVGASLVVIGGSNILSSFSFLFDLSSIESFQPGEFMEGFFIGGITVALGFIMLGFGAISLLTANTRAIFRYAATETAPASSIMTEPVASDFSKGIKRRDFGLGRLGSSEKVMIKVRCRNCGYLETEDADYCSKCRQQM